MGFRGEVIGVVHGAKNQLLLHSYSEDSVSFLQFFVPVVIRVRVRQFEGGFDALTVSEDYTPVFPIDQGVVALQPIMPEINVPFSQVGDGEVDSLLMSPNSETEFYELGYLSPSFLVLSAL